MGKMIYIKILTINKLNIKNNNWHIKIFKKTINLYKTYLKWIEVNLKQVKIIVMEVISLHNLINIFKINNKIMT